MYRSYEIGGRFFGVRTNSEPVGVWLDEVLAEYEVTDAEADPYYSIYVAEERGIGKSFHVLYREAIGLVRTFDLETLGQALLSELASYTLPEREEAIHIEAAVVAKDGATALVRSAVQRGRLRLARASEDARPILVVGDAGHRPLQGQSHGGACAPANSPGILSALARFVAIGGPNGASGARAGSDLRSIDVCCIFVYPALELIEPMSRARAVYNFAYFTRNLDRLGHQALEGLASVLGNARCYRLREATPREALTSLKTVLSEDR